MNKLLDKYPNSIRKELKKQLEILSIDITNEYVINDKYNKIINKDDLYNMFLKHFLLNDHVNELKICVGLTAKGENCTRSVYNNTKYCKTHFIKYKHTLNKYKMNEEYIYDVIELKNNNIIDDKIYKKIYINGLLYNTDGKYIYDENNEKCGYKNEVNEYTVCYDPFILDSISI